MSINHIGVWGYLPRIRVFPVVVLTRVRSQCSSVLILLCICHELAVCCIYLLTFTLLKTCRSVHYLWLLLRSCSWNLTQSNPLQVPRNDQSPLHCPHGKIKSAGWRINQQPISRLSNATGHAERHERSVTVWGYRWCGQQKKKLGKLCNKWKEKCWISSAESRQMACAWVNIGYFEADCE